MACAVHVLLRDLYNAASADDSTVLLKKDSILTALLRGHHLPECLFAYHLPPYFEGIDYWTKSTLSLFCRATN